MTYNNNNNLNINKFLSIPKCKKCGKEYTWSYSYKDIGICPQCLLNENKSTVKNDSKEESYKKYKELKSDDEPEKTKSDIFAAIVLAIIICIIWYFMGAILNNIFSAIFVVLIVALLLFVVNRLFLN